MALANVGHVEITVHANTQKLERQIKENVAREAMKASSEFHKLIRNSYKLQAGLGSAAEALASLVGGLGAFVGVAGNAAASGTVLVGLMAQFKVAGLVAKQAFSGISQAVQASGSGTTKTLREIKEEMQQLAFAAESAALSEEKAALNLEKAREKLAQVQNLPPDNRARREAQLAYQEADLAYRKAKDKNADLQEQIANPKKKTSGAGADPYAKLTESQKTFAKYLASVKPRLMDLREAAASSFLPALQGQMERLFRGGYFKLLVEGFREVSKGLATAVDSLSNTVFDPKGKESFALFFKSTSKNVGTFGQVLGNVFKSFLTLMRAISPLMSQFMLFLDKKSAKLASDMQNNFAGLSGFMRLAGENAAKFGKIFGKIWTTFTNWIKANIGPGTGGQMLLDWMSRSKGAVTELDRVVADFERREYFKAAAENTKSMFQFFSGFGRVFKELGSSPSTKQFFDTLALGRGSLEEIIVAFTNHGPALANLINAMLQLLAAFVDSGQLEAYLVVLGSVAATFAQIFEMLKPIMQVIGPVVGAFGALVTTFLIMGKVAKIAFGTILVGSRALAIIQGGLLLRQGALTTAQLAGATAAGVQGVANTGLIGTFVGLGGTMDKAAISAARMWMAVTGPVGLAIAGIAAVGLAIAGMNAAIQRTEEIRAAKAAQVYDQYRSRALDAKVIETQWQALIGTSAEQYLAQGSAAAVGTDGTKKLNREIGEFLSNTKNMGTLFEMDLQARSVGLSKRKEWTKVQIDSYRAVQGSLDKYRDDLANTAEKDFAYFRRLVRNTIVVNNMSEKAAQGLVGDNEKITKATEKYAKALGDTIYNLDGTVNAQKRLDYILGEGVAAQKLAIQKAKEFKKTLKESLDTFIDFQGPLQQNAEDLKGWAITVRDSTGKAKFSFDKYINDITKQFENQQKFVDNLKVLYSKIGTSGFTEAAYMQIVSQGAAGADLAASLAADVNAANKSGATTVKSLKQYSDLVAMQMDTEETTNKMTRALETRAPLFKLLSKKYGKNWKTIKQDFVDELDAGTKTIFQIAKEQGFNVDDLFGAASGAAVDVATNVDVEASWKEGTLGALKADLGRAIGKYKLEVTPEGRKDGGLVGRVYPKFYADGGPVFGAGGPRSDRVPAMLSNGEFVVNAAATRQNMSLLKAINSGQTVGGVNVTVNAAPGMDEQQVAALVAFQLQTQLRRGATS